MRLFLQLILLLSLLVFIDSLKDTKVVIAGAGNSVGYLVFKNLLERKEFMPVGLVRDKAGYDKLRRLGVDDSQVKICDITVGESLEGLFDGAKKAVICTTAKPKRKLSYKIKSIFRWLVRKGRPPRPEELYYDKNERPYEVDYLGQKNIIDECVNAQVGQIVLLSSMGGYRGSKLNDIDRINKPNPDPFDGNIFIWKRRAERYLINHAPYTIIHAATLTDEPGDQREIVWNTDDALLRTPFKTIPREDVAEVIIQALLYEEAYDRSIDIASGPEKRKTNWIKFWSIPGNCAYPVDET